MAAAGPTRILYLAHDLDDSAIWRRHDMLCKGGAMVRLAGFRRGTGDLQGSALVLGQTRNGQMAARVVTVLRTLPKLASTFRDGPAPDVIMARNLEMLALAVSMRRQFPKARIVYELLDVHRLLLGPGPISRTLRAVEAGLMRQTTLVIVSSPGFVRHYLRPFHRPARQVALVENKPLLSVMPDQSVPAEGPIRIGWFGVLRCAWSLAMLDRLTRGDPGRWRVVLRGKPALDVMPDFHAIHQSNPDLHYLGPYRSPEDLAAIYAEIDISWLIDRYEAGGNSDWLLPNRLYEGSAHGAVPLTIDGTEVAARLRTLGVGMIAQHPSEQGLGAALSGVDRACIATLRAALTAMPRATWEAGLDDCRALVALLEDDGSGVVAGRWALA